MGMVKARTTPGGDDLGTREGVLRYLEFQKGAVHGLFERAGTVRPHAVIIGDRDPDTGREITNESGAKCRGVFFVFPENMFGPEGRDTFSAGLRDMITRTHACGILTVLEMWRVHAQAAPGQTPLDVRASLPADLTQVPGREEGILLLLEHVALEHTVELWSPIERSSSGKARALPFRDVGEELGMQPTGRMGRFMNLLRRSAS